MPELLKRAALALLVMLALGSAVMAQDITFTGDVAYRERMALPSDAALTISLVSLPDQKRIVGANASLSGKVGSPIQFTLNVRSSVLASGGAYGLIAEIRSAGTTIFANPEPVIVDPHSPSGILVPVIRSAMPQNPPAPPPVEPANPLLDIVWTVTSIGGDPVLPNSRLTLSIAADHRAGGSGGCNNYFTEASFDVPPLAFGPVAGTRMACDPALMAQEARYFAALAATAGYDLIGDTLKLLDPAGIALVGLVRTP